MLKLTILSAPLFLFLFVTLLITPVHTQETTAKLEKIASCGPNSLFRWFSKEPVKLSDETRVQFGGSGRPRGTFKSKAVVRKGYIYSLKFENWSTDIPGGRTEALKLFRTHCSMQGRGNHPVVIER